jgi:hypothetical protein
MEGLDVISTFGTNTTCQIIVLACEYNIEYFVKNQSDQFCQVLIKTSLTSKRNQIEAMRLSSSTNLNAELVLLAWENHLVSPKHNILVKNCIITVIKYFFFNGN